MATKKTVSSCETNEIGWLPSNNHARHISMQDNSEEARRKRGVQLNDGWWVTQPIVAVEATEEFKALFKAHLEELWARLEGLTMESPMVDPAKPNEKPLVVSAAQMREAFQARWFHNGKISVDSVKYDGVNCFQRGGALDYANAYRMAKGEKILDTVPIVVKSLTLTERIIECSRENFGKTAGFLDVSNHWPTIFKVCKDFYVANGKRATFKDIVDLVSCGDKAKVGRAQKAFPILILDGRFPELNIVKKICEAGVDKDGKDLGQEYGTSIDRAKVIELEKATRITDIPKGTIPVGKESVAEYFAEPTPATKGNSPLGKAQLSDIINRSSCNALKYAAACILFRRQAEAMAFFEDPRFMNEFNRMFEESGLKIPQA